VIGPGTFDGVMTPLAAMIVGGVLLAAGRRLFWLAVGAAGFVFALVLALRYLDPEPLWLLLGVALVAGIAGAVLAMLLQRLAVALAGFLAGGWLGLALWIQIGGAEGWPALGAFMVTGLVVAILAGAVFELALVVVSSLIGALLIAGGIGAEGLFGLALVAVLTVAGSLIQTSFGRHRRDD
jgi:hypothetical protein